MTSLGSGTYGNVQKDRKDSSMAIKTLHFMNMHSAIREIIILKKINHPNIIRLKNVEIDFPEFQINLYIDRFDCDLDRFIEERTITPDIISKITEGLFSAMVYLHRRNILHRDIAPGNILIKWDKTKSIDNIKKGRSGYNNRLTEFSNIQIVLCDFGLAVVQQNPIQKHYDSGVCTATYRPPEVYTGMDYSNYTSNIDVWSFGCILYYLLTGIEMMDWGEYYDLFMYKRKESSRYLCHFFNLPDYNNHLTRMKALKTLDKNFLKSFFSKRLKQLKVPTLLQNKYLSLLVSCLTPNPKERLYSEQLSNMYPFLLVDDDKNTLSSSNIDVIKLNRLLDKDVSADTKVESDGSDSESCYPFSCFSRSIIGFDKELDTDNDFKAADMSKMIQLAKQSPVWELGQKIYNKLLAKKPYRNTVVWMSACLYIASQVLEINDNEFETHLLDICTPIQFGFVIVYILHTLDWTL